MKNEKIQEKSVKEIKKSGSSNQPAPEEPKKDDNTFIFAAILFGSIIVGTIVLILKMFGLF